MVLGESVNQGFERWKKGLALDCDLCLGDDFLNRNRGTLCRGICVKED